MKRMDGTDRLCLAVILASVLLLGFAAEAEESQTDHEKYEPTWESLTRHSVPEWLLDAKFGIYAHWGVYSVPAYGSEWYGRLMYDKNNPRNVYEHHKETYGGPSEFGYKDFVPMFKAEHFDPDDWAEVIKQSGARYAGIAVVHHDGFALWDSEINRWNAGNMGPHRDLYGDLVKALRKKDLKVIATFHHIRTFNWFIPEDKEEAGKKGYDLFAPEYADFYWNEATSTIEEFITLWKAKVMEVIEKYRPDVLWFDGGDFQGLDRGDDVGEVLANYYNKSLAWGKEVDVLNKLPVSGEFNFPRDFGVLTFEAGRDRPEYVDRPWIDDEKIGRQSWGYIENLEYRKVDELIDGLVDRVSRNGGLVLSLSPKANGELPEEQKDILLAMGKWLKVNGEAIYGTRPWKVQAEGPIDKLRTELKGHKRWVFEKCSSEDIRFTRKGDDLFAVVLGWPDDGQLIIKSLGTDTKLSTAGISSVSLLGVKEELDWSRDSNGLTVLLPEEKPCEYAYAFKIELNGEMILR